MLAAAVAELDVLLLEMGRIGQHGQAQVDGGRRRVNRPGVAVVDQRGKISAVIDVGVRKNHAVDAGHRKREMTVAFKGVAAASLVQTAVEKESLSCRLDVVHGPGNRLGGAPKSDSHSIYNQDTMRAAVLFLACAFPRACLAQKKPITLETMEEAARLAPQGPGNPVAWAPTASNSSIGRAGDW